MLGDPIPAFLSPLTDHEHAQLGRLAVLWGQIDFFLDLILIHTTGLSKAKLVALQVFEKPVGAKINLLKASLADVENEETRDKLARFIRILDDTKQKRNHAFHGVWGWRYDLRGPKATPCARHDKNPTQPMRPEEFPRLEKIWCEASRLGLQIKLAFEGYRDRPEPGKFLHGPEPDYAEWLQQWSGRNPPTDNILDRSYKAGQLPRLSKRVPPK